MIDLITGHQGFAHITAEQVANVNNALTAGYGDNAVLRLKDGAVTSTGLSIGVGVGYWRANGFDAEITSAETIYVDPSSVGTSRIDKFYIEILQDIPSGNQRAELVYVKGTEASVPTPPADPTAPALTTDIMLQCVCYASAVIQENSLTLTDLTKTIQNVTPEDMTLVKSWIRDNANVYSPSMPYYRGEVVITPLDGKIYECNEFCSANTWENNQSHFTERTIIDILSKIGKQTTEIHKYGTCVTAAATTEKKINTEYGDFKLEIGRGVYAKFSYANTASSPTLKVDSATAKTIKGYGSSDPSTWWKAGDIVHFVYDGTNFVMLPTQGQITDLNQALTWKLIDTKVCGVSSNISIANISYMELLVHVYTFQGTLSRSYSWHINKSMIEALTSTSQSFIEWLGGDYDYYNSQNYGDTIQLKYTKSTSSFSCSYTPNTNANVRTNPYSNFKISVYYR